MEYHFKNLIFEGGGVKGIAYASALEILQEKEILKEIKRVAGTSAGAITAALLAIGFTPKEILQILKETDFNKFKDDSFFKTINAIRVIKKYGWFKGTAFLRWFEETISKKVIKDITFAQLQKIKGSKELYIIGTNLNKKESEIFSFETSPEMKISDAVRISMSIPLFFKAIRNKSLFVDGGLYYNFPLNIFDNKKYLFNKRKYSQAGYYKYQDAIYNKESLGLRVDSVDEISKNLGKINSQSEEISSFKEYLAALLEGLVETANRIHLHKNDWHRTVYIESGGVKATEFSLSKEKINNLIENGRRGTLNYFKWFDSPKPGEEIPLNK